MPQQLTQNQSSALQHAGLTGSQLVTFKSFDGLLISAFVWLPPNVKRDGKAPAVLIAHGGPDDQMYDSFNPRATALLSHGYAVIAPNVRGSTGYGWDFQHANYKDLGGSDLKDELGIVILKNSLPRSAAIMGACKTSATERISALASIFAAY